MLVSILEAFDNTADLLSEILIRGIAGQVKKGLYREYHSKEDSLVCLRGKINISATIKQQVQMRRQLEIIDNAIDELKQDAAKEMEKELKKAMKKWRL